MLAASKSEKARSQLLVARHRSQQSGLNARRIDHNPFFHQGPQASWLGLGGDWQVSVRSIKCRRSGKLDALSLTAQADIQSLICCCCAVRQSRHSCETARGPGAHRHRKPLNSYILTGAFGEADPSPGAGRRRIRQHLENRIARHVEMLCRLALRHPYEARKTAPQIQVHGIDPRTLLPSSQKENRWTTFTPPAAGLSRRYRGRILHRRSHHRLKKSLHST